MQQLRFSLKELRDDIEWVIIIGHDEVISGCQNIGKIKMETKLGSSNAFPGSLGWWSCHGSDNNDDLDDLDNGDNLNLDDDDYGHGHDGDNDDDNGHGHDGDGDWTTRAVAQDELNAADSEKITGIGILTFIR